MADKMTTLGFRVEGDDLQQLAALLGTISALMANLGAGPGTYGAPSGSRLTAPPTPNYNGPTGPAPNVSSGGRPNPAALGGIGVPTPGPGPAFSGPALGGTGGTFSLTGAITLQITGSLTIHAAGTVTVQGGPGSPGGAAPATPGATGPTAAPGAGGGGAPPAPQTPPATGGGGGRVPPPGGMFDPYNPLGSLGDPNAAFGGGGVGRRVGLGMILGHPTQYLGQGQAAYEAGAQFYIGQQIGNAVSSYAQPFLNEARLMNGGLNRVTSEQIEAGRWQGAARGGGALAGALAGMGIGSMIAPGPGTLIGGGIGFALGATGLGALADWKEDALKRGEAVRLASEPMEAAFGLGPRYVRGLTPNGPNAPRIGGAGIWWDDIRHAFGWDRPTGKSGDITTIESMDLLKRLNAPGGTVNLTTRAALNSLHRQLGDKWLESATPALGGLMGNPVLNQQIEGLNRGDVGVFSPTTASENAVFLGATGNLSGALGFAAIARDQGASARNAVEANRLFVRRRAISSDLQSVLGLGQAEVGLLRETLGSSAAAARLRSPDVRDSLRGLVETAESSASEFEDRARRATTDSDRYANLGEARRYRTQAAGARQQMQTLPYQAAELDFAQSSAILGSRGEQAQIALGRRGRTNLFDERVMGGLYDRVTGVLKEQLEASFTELRQMKAAGAPAEKVAPIYSAIARIEDDLDRQILERFERKWHDAAMPGRAASAIGGAQLGAITGTGGVYGPEMQGAFNIQRGGAAASLSVAQQKYQAAVAQFGASSPQAIAAAVDVEQARAEVAVLPFKQIGEKYSGIQNVAGSAAAIVGGGRQLVLGAGLGSGAAMPATLGQLTNADQQIAIARARLQEDTRAGAGPQILGADRAAIVSRQVERQNLGLGATDVQMPAAFEVEQLKARNKMQRLESSFMEPGSMLDQFSTLYSGAEKRLQAIDSHEKQLRDAGVAITPTMAARFEQQRENTRMEMFQYRSRAEEGWIDRLVSYSQGAPSFAMRARPTMSEAARALENGQSYEGFRQSRSFGFVSSRGYEYERARGFTTAGKGGSELFPGDLAQMALYGTKNGKPTMPKTGGGATDPGLADLYGGGDGTGATEDTQQQLLEALNQHNTMASEMLTLLRIIAGGGGAAVPGMGGAGHSGPTPHGQVGVYGVTQMIALDRVPGDNQRPRR